jgi:hypothetical protein
MSNSDYFDLTQLKNSAGYQKLLALWAHEYAALMMGLQKAAAKGQESAWRYYAGQLKGADLITGQLERALLQMEKEGETNNPGTDSIEELLNEVRGEKK